MSIFEDIVARCFHPLEPFGFQKDARVGGVVRFVRGDITIVIAHDPRGELTMEIETAGPKTMSILIAEVPGVSGRRAILTRPDNLEYFITWLSELLIAKYTPVLRGDLHQLPDLWNEDCAKAEVTTRQFRRGRELALAEIAWRERRYDDVARLLGAREDLLSPAERRRLAYSLRHRSS